MQEEASKQALKVFLILQTQVQVHTTKFYKYKYRNSHTHYTISSAPSSPAT